MLVPRRVLTVAPATALAAALLAAPAPAATVTTLPCNVDVGVQRSVPIRGAGFTPGGTVRLSYVHPALTAPNFATSAPVDGAGNFGVTAFPAPFNSFRTREQSFGLTAEDPNPALNTGTTFRQVRYGVSVFPSSGRPSRRVRYTARGFAPGRNVYAHFRFAGRTRRNVKIGNPVAPCGKKSRRMRLIPARSRVGTWTVYFDQRRSFSRSTRPQFRSSITVRRTFSRR